MSDTVARLAALIRTRSFARGDFTLASGKKSPFYFNLKPTMMTAEGAWLCARAFLDRIAPDEADLIGGLEMGAVPIVAATAAMAYAEGRKLDAFFVRKQPKEHGTKASVEGFAPGESLAGRRIVIAEDTMTTGGSALKAVQAIRDMGGDVRFMLTILDREEGARELFAQNGLELRAVLTIRDFV
jgi:orotate phosphoribosyltransferase